MKSLFKSRRVLSEESVRQALRGVMVPGTEQNLVEAGLISGISLHEGRVGVTLAIAMEQKEQGFAWREACQRALEALEGVSHVTVVLTAERAPPAGAAELPQKARAQWNLTPVEGVRRIITVASGKGGVGKSTTAVHLAAALARRGLRVGLLDADIYGPSLPRMLGISGKPALTEDRKLIPLERHGIPCMSAGFLMEGGAAVLRGPMITKALHQMLRGTAWGKEGAPLDVLVIDLPPGTGDVQLSLAQQAPLGHAGGGAIIVTTPQEVALDDARKAIDMFRKAEVPVLGVIENMSYFRDPGGVVHRLFGEGGGERLAREAGVPLLGSIPLDPAIREGGDAGNIPDTSAHYEEVLAKIPQSD